MSEDLQQYIHRQIPITAAMGVSVDHADPTKVQLSAPLAANINHRETVFGGSAAAVATLAAWTLVLVRMRDANVQGRLVIAANQMTYDRPITGDFQALALAKDLQHWDRFLAGFQRKGKGRVQVSSRLLLDNETVGRFEGTFVALQPLASD